MRLLRTLSLIAFGIVLAAVAGLAYGTVGQGGVINGCYKNTTPHNLQVLDPAVTTTCPSGTSTLDWNQHGPPGPRGPSNAYSTYHDGSQNLNANGSDTAVGSLKLPAGSFVIIAKADLNVDNNANAAGGGCTITAGSDTDSSRADLNWLAPGVNTSSTAAIDPITLTVVHTFAKGGGNAQLTCFLGDAGLDGVAQNVKITAIQVGTLSNAGF